MNRRHARLAALALLGALGMGGCRSSCCRTRCPSPAAPAYGPALASIAPSKKPQVLLEFVVISVPNGDVAQVTGATSPSSAQAPRALTPEDALALQVRASKTPSARVVQAPAIVTTSDDEATIQVGEAPDANPADWTGFRLQVTPRVAALAGAITLDAFRAVERTGSPPVEQTIAASGVPVGNGKTLLLVAPAVGESARFVVLVTATVIPPSS